MGKNKQIKKLRQLAEGLGLTKLLVTVLYGRPRRVEHINRFGDDLAFLLTGMSFKQRIPDIILAVGKYCKDVMDDPSFKQAGPTTGRTSRMTYLVPKAKLYVELVTKLAGVLAVRAGNVVAEIKIFSEDKAHITEIAKVINHLFADGLLANMDWEKVEDKFEVKREDCIATWKSLLS
jgi:hypothetical protein